MGQWRLAFLRRWNSESPEKGRYQSSGKGPEARRIESCGLEIPWISR